MMKNLLIPLLFVCSQLAAQEGNRGTIAVKKESPVPKLFNAIAVKDTGGIQMFDSLSAIVSSIERKLTVADAKSANMLHAIELKGDKVINWRVLKFDISVSYSYGKGSTSYKSQFVSGSKFFVSGSKFNEEAINLLLNCKAGNSVYFSNIVVINDKKERYKMPPLSYFLID